MESFKNYVWIVLSFYCTASYFLFKYIYLEAPKIIDEEFHLPQGLAYCNFNFSTWDPKITTLPGLYILSAGFIGLLNMFSLPIKLFLGPVSLCNTYYLRFINYVAGIINLCLFFVLFCISRKRLNREIRFLSLFSSFNLALLPPLIFFTNIYYTDVVSIMFIMFLMVYNRLNKHVHASVCGLLSVLIRQTNIIWVVMLFGEYMLQEFHYYCIKVKNKRSDSYEVTEDDVKRLTIRHLRRIFVLHRIPREIWFNIYAYLISIFIFIIFLVINGGIVVGDKTAHVAVIHIPQIFYFSLFCLVFAWPHFLQLIIPFINHLKKNTFCSMIIMLIIATIVHYNTLVHPYLLADNRHYTFYIWNRFYEKILLFRYAIIPVYLFGLYSIIWSTYSKDDITFILVYLPCTMLVLILQKMIEVRYFLIPFIILRSRIQCNSMRILSYELSLYFVINVASLSVFFTKDIYWSDFKYIQKLIW